VLERLGGLMLLLLGGLSGADRARHGVPGTDGILSLAHPAAIASGMRIRACCGTCCAPNVLHALLSQAGMAGAAAALVPREQHAQRQAGSLVAAKANFNVSHSMLPLWLAGWWRQTGQGWGRMEGRMEGRIGCRGRCRVGSRCGCRIECRGGSRGGRRGGCRCNSCRLPLVAS